MLSSGTIYGHKNKQGEIVSSAAIFPYGETLASIGTVIVNEHCRGCRLGREVTEACIQSVADDATRIKMRGYKM
ncbi:GNAT family N-acetyltransferase [Paenibacillus jiagnxiensis]|uniref:GNAT family N-acetyltransferase n=1 Tax=Paenibacillus jiagnxiensis TaxID=3228926 RepID=UPI0033A85B82